MSFHPLRFPGTTAGPARRVLVAFLLAVLAITSFGCAVHSQASGHSHAETSALSRHAATGTDFMGSAPVSPHSGEVCVTAARSGQQEAPPKTPSDAAPFVAAVAALSVRPAAARLRRPRLRAIRTGRTTLTHVCCWRI